MSIVLIWVGLIFKIFPSKFSLRVAGVSVAEFITVRFQPASDFIVKSMMLLPGK